MRIHTDHLYRPDFWSAARVARVDMTLTEHGSRSRARAYNVLLTGESRRRPNSGNRGSGDEYAATWDQWGVFLAELFAADAAACGVMVQGRAFDGSQGMVTPYYSDAEEFANLTGDRFGAPEDIMEVGGYVRRFVSHGWPSDAHGDHTFRFEGTPFEQSCTKCTAVQRWGRWGS